MTRRRRNPQPQSGIPIALSSDMDPEVVRHETIAGLIRGILTDLKTLIREEIALARVEVREQAGRARAAALSFGLAAAALLFGVAFLLIAIATAIADQLGWPLWAGFLIVSLFILPIAIFSNFVRVLILILVTYHFGEAAGQGFLHDFAGLTVFAIAIVTIFAIDSVASNVRERRESKR